MQVSSTMTYGQVSQYIRRYFETPNPFGALTDYDMFDMDDGKQSLDEAVVVLPPTSKITAPLSNDLTFSRQHAQSREKDLQADRKVSRAARAAVQRLSDTPMSTAATLIEVNYAEDIRREVRADTRAFFYSNKRRRQAKTQKLRTTRTYANLAASQRRQIKSEVKEKIKQKLKAKNQTNTHMKTESQESQQEETMTNPEDPEKVQIIPIILHWTGGSCVGSRVKGHAKRGDGKMCHQHRLYGVLAHTDEHRTSQVCCACFQQVELAWATRA
ncbi:hypothetical protein BGZ96_002465 [Linnemannia gamsii]|uniref:Uncharacterized protein n=1 Tax=Linnemannia gamsii TaxID=64522 RepID=A0ABQ7K8M3_9FUNG|nr:hypothetical protein BGZ96_002465 [Linnemannia gamsii]